MGQDSDSSSATASGGTSWGWVFTGVAVGAVLLVTLVPIVRNVPPRPDVAILVGALAFGLMGVLVAYRSPGDTSREAALAGVILAFVAFAGIRVIEGVEVSLMKTAGGFIAAIVLAGAGGWVGEVLQGTYRDGPTEGLQWPWIGVGTLLGVMLSVYAVFLPNALWDVGAWGILGLFAGSFLVAAFFVGYFSPGVTILEPALAGIMIIIVDTLLALLGFGAPFPLGIVVFGMVAAFGLALVGGYTGEVVHNLRFGAAWGDEDGVFKEAPKPQ